MKSTLDAFTADGRVIISFPEAAIPAAEKEEFISFMKAEWLARQSRLPEAGAKALADEVDATWWTRNRSRILRAIGEG